MQQRCSKKKGAKATGKSHEQATSRTFTTSASPCRQSQFEVYTSRPEQQPYTSLTIMYGHGYSKEIVSIIQCIRLLNYSLFHNHLSLVYHNLFYHRTILYNKYTSRSLTRSKHALHAASIVLPVFTHN